jgi:hypothetical protein
MSATNNVTTTKPYPTNGPAVAMKEGIMVTSSGWWLYETRALPV